MAQVNNNKQTMGRFVTICADDYGVDPNVDQAIVELARQGRLTATSVLVDAQISASSIAQVQALEVDLGLHLNFTEVLGELAAQAVMPLSVLIAKSHARRLSTAWVRGNIDRQLDRFEALFKRPPAYVDGHLHVHQLPIIREQLLDALGGIDLPKGFWLRDTRAGRLTQSPWSERWKAWIIGHLGMGQLAVQAQRHHIGINRGFFGVYDFTKPHRSFMQMMTNWLEHAESGALIMTHPSRQAIDNDPIGQARVEEYAALGSQTFADLLEERGVSLARASHALSGLP